MTSAPQALIGARILAPDAVLEGRALLIDRGTIAGIVAERDIPATCRTVLLEGGWLLPGFIDTQVNGGGDVLFNDAPTIDGIRAIATAHRRFGTTGLLPTLISDDLSVVAQAIDAVDAAIEAEVPGILGIHIEGPFLNPSKRGIHDASKFRKLDEAAIALLTRPSRGVRLLTIAPELAPAGAIARLAAAGVIVAAGHSLADYDEIRAALDDGLHGFTHLFNAMTQLGSRDPGMVGAALDDRSSRFGLIVDGQHVHPAAMRIAIAARGIDGVMLVTDAMPPVGGERDSFALMDRAIRVIDGSCRGDDGTLAGSALSMAAAVRNTMDLLGRSLADAAVMASGNPADFLGLGGSTGRIAIGLAGDLVHLDEHLRVTRSWIGGVLSHEGE